MYLYYAHIFSATATLMLIFAVAIYSTVYILQENTYNTSTMAQVNSPRNNKYISPDKKKQKGSQVQAVSKPREKKKQEKADRKTKTTLDYEQYLAPYDTISVWTKGWQFEDIIGIVKTKLQPFDELFGESENTMHEDKKSGTKPMFPTETEWYTQSISGRIYSWKLAIGNRHSSSRKKIKNSKTSRHQGSSHSSNDIRRTSMERRKTGGARRHHGVVRSTTNTGHLEMEPASADEE